MSSNLTVLEPAPSSNHTVLEPHRPRTTPSSNHTSSNHTVVEPHVVDRRGP
jgi:hypothetical protein